MINTLFLPELREMLADGHSQELTEFCTALHPAKTAEFMEGLDGDEMWKVLQHAPPPLQAEIFHYFPWDRKVDLLATQDVKQVAMLVTALPADDAVDLLQEVDENRVEQILVLVPAADRRDIRRLQTFPEGTAGALMTTEAACLAENLTVRQAMDELSRQAEHLETIHYIYVTDDTNHLRGVVSTRSLVSAIGKPHIRLGELMKKDLVTANVRDDQEVVAQKVAHYNLMALPVVDDEYHMMGIITHDDIIDVMREEATEDVQRIAAVEPLEDSYMRTPLSTLSWKRGIWLTILFLAGMLTAFLLRYYNGELERHLWLVWFFPLITGCGGNTGSQSSTLIITALAVKEVHRRDWKKVIRREVVMGLVLGTFLGVIGFLCALFIAPTVRDATVIPITVLLVVLCGACTGGLLPLCFERLGWDPALMSNPFVAGISDILGLLIYVNVSILILG